MTFPSDSLFLPPLCHSLFHPPFFPFLPHFGVTTGSPEPSTFFFFSGRFAHNSFFLGAKAPFLFLGHYRAYPRAECPLLPSSFTPHLPIVFRTPPVPLDPFEPGAPILGGFHGCLPRSLFFASFDPLAVSSGLVLSPSSSFLVFSLKRKSPPTAPHYRLFLPAFFRFPIV